MRADGERIEDIVKYLRSNDVKRLTKITRTNKKVKTLRPNASTLTKLFKDSFYYGVLIQNSQEVD